MPAISLMSLSHETNRFHRFNQSFENLCQTKQEELVENPSRSSKPLTVHFSPRLSRLFNGEQYRNFPMELKARAILKLHEFAQSLDGSDEESLSPSADHKDKETYILSKLSRET